MLPQEEIMSAERKQIEDRIKVKEAWITGDDDLYIQLSDGRKMVLHAEAIEGLEQLAAREQEEGETEWPKAVIVDLDSLEESFRSSKEDVKKTILDLLKKYGGEKVQINEKLVGELVGKIAMPGED
jgi:hypothetical protein